MKAYVATLAASLGIPEDKINSVTKAIESGNSEEIAKAVKEATDSIKINKNMMQPPGSNPVSMSPEMFEQAKNDADAIIKAGEEEAARIKEEAKRMGLQGEP